MPSKKRKYNARFPAGRIKKIMQTDEEVGKVAQAVPIIISRTLELFVESLLNKALRVTMSRNAKTLSPSHVKQCILAEARFDFLKDLVKNIPDVSIAEEKEMMNDENSPNSSRFSDTSGPHRRLAREDSNSSSSSEIRVTSGQAIYPSKDLRRGLSAEAEKHKVETVTSAPSPTDGVIDLSIKSTEEHKPVIRTANFYQETMPDDQPKSVITLNPSYGSPQPSTSSYANLTPVEPLQRLEKPVPKREHKLYLDIRQNNTSMPSSSTPVKPLINIDFSKDLAKPEIKVLDKSVADMVGVPKNDKKVQRQNSRSQKAEVKKVEAKTVYPPAPVTMGDNISGDLLIDEDYDT